MGWLKLSHLSQWGLHDFCPILTTFHMWAITHAWLIAPFSDEGVGRCGETQAEYGILISSTKHCDWVWMGLWPHSSVGPPHQAHIETLQEVAHRLVLLADVSADWLYAFVWLNDAMSYAPLMNERHISAVMDGVPSMDTCGQLHQLQIQKLLQHKCKVVFPEDLNGELKALQFTFPELHLWDVATPSESFWEPWLLEVDLHSA